MKLSPRIGGVFSLFSALVLVSACALGQNTTWNGSVSSAWGAGANWSAGVPNATLNAVVPTGTPNAPSTAGAAATCRSLTVNSGATLTLGAGGPLSVNENLTLNGTVGGAETLTLTGSLGMTMAGTGTANCALTVAKSAATVSFSATLTVNGTFTLQSGTFLLSVGSIRTLTVNGSAVLSGGELSTSSLGVLDVNGSVTCSGTVCTFGPTIRCSGNWIGHAAFAPTSGGGVLLDGVGAQSVSGTAVFFDLTVAVGSVVTATGALDVNGALTVNGVLDTSAATADIDGAATVATGGAWSLGTQQPTVGGTLIVNGPVTGSGAAAIVMDGAIGCNLSGTSTLPALTIDKSGAAPVSLTTNLTVNGAFTLDGGTLLLSVTGVRTLTVNGSAVLSGGELSISSLGVLDVNGSVTCSGTVCTFGPTIRCSGNWVGHAAFAPTSGGIAFFDGVGAQSVAGPAAFFDLTVAVGSVVTATGALDVIGAMTVNGSLDTSAATADIDGAATVATGGAWSLGTQQPTVGGTLIVNGPVTGSGAAAIVMDGAIGCNLSGTSTLPALTIDKSGTAPVSLTTNLTVNGAFTLEGGTLTLSVTGTRTLTVNGSAVLSGGELSYSSIGILDVNGDVTCSGTVCTFGPTIRCSGNWIGHAAFAPTSGGIAFFDGVGAQSVSGPAAFFDLTVAVGSVVTTTGALDVNGALTVNGVLDTSAATADIDGAATVATGGAWNLGTQQPTVGGTLIVNGPVTGSGAAAIVMDGAIGCNLSGTSTLPALTIDKSGTAPVSLTTNLTVNGAFTLEGGTLTLSVTGTRTLTVNGSAVLSGGELSYSSIGVLDVGGNVTCSGTVCTFMPDIRCAGDWNSDAAFAPTTGGVLTLDGGGPATFRAATIGGTITLPGLVVASGAKTAAASVVVAAPTISISSGATLSTGVNPLTLHRAAGTTVVTANGVLEAASGGVLGLGPQSTTTVSSTGTLRLPGVPEARATIEGVPTGGFALIVNGTIFAKNCDILRPGANGLVVNSGATLAAPPNDLRGAAFDFPAGPGARLLSITRLTATNLRYTEFRNTGGVAGAFGASCTSGAAISFTNWFGALSGPAFENDPGNRIAWSAPEVPVLSFLGAVPGVSLATLLWTMTYTVDTSGYLIDRSDGGPYAFVAEPAEAGPGTYNYVDQPLTPYQSYTYALYAHLTHGPLVFLGTTTVAPYFAAPPSNVLDVGPAAAYTTPQAAIDFAVLGDLPGTILRVQPGVYPRFVVSAVPPGGLRIYADLPGAVIDTTTGPVTIQNLGLTETVQISGFDIGGVASPNDGLIVQNCAGPVYVDDCLIAADAGHEGVRFTSSAGAVLQRSNVVSGFTVAGGSNAAANGGSVDALVVQGGSTLRTCGFTTASSSVDMSSTRIDYAGSAVELDVPLFTSIGTPGVFDMHGFTNATFSVFASLGPAYLADVGPIIEMPVLVDLLSLFLLFETSTNGVGDASVTIIMPSVPAFLGFPLALQGVSLNTVDGHYRLSNFATIVAVT